MKPLRDGGTYKERHSLQAFRLKITPEQETEGTSFICSPLSVHLHPSLSVCGWVLGGRARQRSLVFSTYRDEDADQTRGKHDKLG